MNEEKKARRYITRRKNRDGSARWYWQRPGQSIVRLPDNFPDRIARAAHLNAAADAAGQPGPDKGSTAWVVAQYRASDDYKALAPGSVKYYRRYIEVIETIGADLPFAAWDREAVIDFIESYPALHQRRKARAVLQNLFGIARYRGIVDVDHSSGIALDLPPPRDRIWSPAEIDAWLESAVGEDAHMTTAFMLLCYTAQRPGDVLALTWTALKDDALTLRQQKTGKLLTIPCHPDLSAHLETVRRDAAVIVSYRARAVSYLSFNWRFRRTATRAGIDAQARDLRRTAMVRLAEAGATDLQIASVSGHTIDATRRILETYIPRTVEQARSAIARLPSRGK